MPKKKKKINKSLDYFIDNRDVVGYTGDASIDSFMANALVSDVNEFFIFEEWFAYRYGLNNKQKKGIKKLQKSLLKGHVKFSVFFKDYDFQNLPKSAKKIIARAFQEVGYSPRDIDLCLESFLKELKQ